MPDEEIDKLVRDAASQHHPPYDDTAWGKMELMLDKHLPQKKDRRKPFIFLLSFLLLGGAAYWGINNTAQNNTATTVTTSTANKPAALADAAAVATIPGNNAGSIAANNTLPGQQLAKTAADANTTAGDVAPTNNYPKTAPLAIVTSKAIGDDNNNGPYAAKRKNGSNQKSRTAMQVKAPGLDDGADNVQTQKTTVEKNDVTDNTISITTTPAKKEATIEKTVVTPATAVAKTDAAKEVKDKTPEADKNNTTSTSAKKKTSKSFSDKLAVTVSAGSDVSFIEINKAGKLKPAYGAGLSYAVGKHITIASGLYVSKKIYTATPYQYKFTGYVNPGLKEIGADCKIFEIPVSVYYNFKQVKNHSWLAGVGLSSLLMKRETYDYRYEMPGGQPYSYEKTVTNENKHYFSVLTLSGGYQYKLNNRFSFIAEPYVKIPLTGIGVGKIKLNSTGVLVTAAIKPFAKKKK